MAFATAWVALGAGVAACGEPAEPDALAAASEHCPDDDWCWIRRRPLMSVSGLELDRVVVTGAEGYFAHWVDGDWVEHILPGRPFATSGVAEDPQHFWATDEDGRVWQYADSQWQLQSVPDSHMAGVLATADGTIWAYGGTALAHGRGVASSLWRREGERWVHHVDAIETCVGPGQLLPRSHDEVLVAILACDEIGVTDAEVHRFDGTQWQLLGSPIPDQNWYPALNEYDGELWLKASALHRWDGNAWLPVEGSPNAPTDLPRLCTSPITVEGEDFCVVDGEVWHRPQRASDYERTVPNALRETSSAANWERIPTALWAGDDSKRAWGSGPTDVYRITDINELEHYDGARWQRVTEGLCGAIGGHGTRVLASCDDGLWVQDAGDARVVPFPEELRQNTRVQDIVVLPSGVALLRADERILRWDDDGFDVLYDDIAYTPVAVAFLAEDDIWMMTQQHSRVADRRLLHYDGQDWDNLDDEDRDSAPSAMTVHRGQVWLMEEGRVQRIEPPGPSYEAEWTPYWSTLTVTDDDIWIETGDQTIRRPR